MVKQWHHIHLWWSHLVTLLISHRSVDNTFCYAVNYQFSMSICLYSFLVNFTGAVGLINYSCVNIERCEKSNVKLLKEMKAQRNITNSRSKPLTHFICSMRREKKIQYNLNTNINGESYSAMQGRRLQNSCIVVSEFYQAHELVHSWHHT